MGDRPDRIIPRPPEPGRPHATRPEAAVELGGLALEYLAGPGSDPATLEQDASATRDRIAGWFVGTHRQDFGATARLLADACVLLQAALIAGRPAARDSAPPTPPGALHS